MDFIIRSLGIRPLIGEAVCRYLALVAGSRQGPRQLSAAHPCQGRDPAWIPAVAGL